MPGSEDRVLLRLATAEDVDLVFDFVHQLAEYEKLAHEVVADVAQLKRSLFGQRPAAEVLFAFVDDMPAGFAVFFHNFSTFLGKPGIYLEDLFVLPKLRRRGIGKRLLQRIAQLAVERGCGRFEWSVLDWNDPAKEFYRRHGAEPMEEWTVYRVTGESLQQLASGD
ncbi:MAG: GNAT family N-acetyltransferase [Candidatus Latescibacterota bacterium]|nr:GNAT family N-acetyltransferase [Candidatus Latescibacterota bacterium]